MLNKNDPLIGAVQEVMKRNQAERDAARLVNEKFGVTDRKAMPHERQHEWDAAYKSVLTEGLHPNQQKLDVHEPEKDKLTAQDFKMLRAKKKPVEEEMKTDPYAEGQASSISTVSQPKKEVTPADQSALKKKIQSVMKEAKVNPYAVGMAAVKKSTGDEPPMEKKNIMKAHKIAKKIIAKKKIDEGFNNRHGLSVTASAEKQAVADQLNERLVDTRQRTSRLAPMHTQGIKQTKARLAREPAEAPKTWTQRAAEIGRGVEATARGFASGLTDVGQTGYGYKSGSDYVLDYITPGRGQNLAREFPIAKEVGKGFGDLAGFVAGPEALVAKGAIKGAKYGSQLLKGLKATEKGAEVATDTAKATTKATQKYANAADELSAAERAKFQRTLDAKMAAGGSAKKPVSQAAREPAADAAKAKPQPATQTTTQVGGARDASGNRIYNKAITDLVDKAAAKPSVAKASQTSVTRTTANPNSPIAKAVRDANAAREPTDVDKFIAKAKETPVTAAGKQPNVSNSGAGIRGTFRDKLAKARQNAGSDPKARQLPALRKTTEPANYVRPGLPAVRPTTSTALTRPGMPNLGAGGATRVVGLSNKAKAGLAATSAAGLAGYAAYKNMGGSKPAVSSTTSTTKDQSRVPQTATQSVLPQTTQRGAEQDKVGVKRTQASAPVKPASPAPATTTASSAAPKAVAPKAPQSSMTPAQRAQVNRAIERNPIASSGRSQKPLGLGVTTGTTIQQKAAPQVNRPVGTGRQK